MADVVSAAPPPGGKETRRGRGIDGNWTLANTEGEVEDDGGGDDVGEVVALLLFFCVLSVSLLTLSAFSISRFASSRTF